MRYGLAILAGSLLLVCGCGSHHRCCGEERSPQADFGQHCPAIEMVAVVPARPYMRGLIFDHRPGYYTGSDFVGRSDWPSSDAYYRTGEVINYREHFHDRQGAGFNHNDYTYRHFDTYRYGTAVR